MTITERIENAISESLINVEIIVDEFYIDGEFKLIARGNHMYPIERFNEERVGHILDESRIVGTISQQKYLNGLTIYVNSPVYYLRTLKSKILKISSSYFSEDECNIFLECDWVEGFKPKFYYSFSNLKFE